MQNLNEKSEKVTKLLNEMEEPEDNDGMGTFEPIEPPELNIKEGNGKS